MTMLSPALRPPSGRTGFTVVELTVVLVLISLSLAMALPRMRTPPEKKVEWAAQQLVRDVELARTRAQATRKRALLVFDVGQQEYVGFLDHDRDGTFAENATEMSAFMGFGIHELNEDVRLSRGTAGPAPGDIPGSDPVTFTATRIQFDSRGIPTPTGTAGYVYLAHISDPTKVAAIRVSPSAAVRMWQYVGGVWQ